MTTLLDTAFIGGIPHHRLADLRASSPCIYASLGGTLPCWHLFRHVDVTACLRGWDRFSSHTGGTTLQDQTDEQVAHNTSLLHTDPPEHSRLRSAFAPSMSRSRVSSLGGAFAAIADELIDECVRNRLVDIPLSLCARMVSYSLCHFLGIPLLLRDHFMRLSALMLADSTPLRQPGAHCTAGLGPASAALYAGSPSVAMVDMLMRYCYDSERDDAFGATAWGESETSERAVEDVLVILATAGTGMTQNSIATMLFQLAMNWDDLVGPGGELAVPPGLLIEESLRHATPLMHVRRTATADIDVCDELIRSGEKVVLWFASANFDPAAFADPRRFVAGRSPNPHISFGAGAHYCLGAQLARLEMQSILEAVLRRCTHLAVVREPTYLPSNFVNEMVSLPARFEGAGT